MSIDRSSFYKTSFFTLTEQQKKSVKDYVNAQKKEELPKIDTTEIFRQQTFLATPLEYYGKRIKRINPVSFRYMTLEQRQSLEEELMFSFYIFSARYQLDHVERRAHALDDRAKQIKKCAELINTLRMTPPLGLKTLPENQLVQETSNGDTPLKYLAMQTITPWVLEVYGEVKDGKIKTGLDLIGAFNERRLYWVWAGGGGLLGMVLKLLSDDFYNKTQAQSILDLPSPITGGLSWILYYFRFGVRLGLLLRHTVTNPWMDEEERNIPWHERLKTQVHQRKYQLMNDFFWAGANLACFFWLIGTGMPGYFGGVLTALLLVMDIGIALSSFEEERAQYMEDMARFRQDIMILHHLKATKKDIEQPLLDRQIKQLYDARRECKLNWDFKLYGLYSDAMYAMGLFCAFALVCSCFFPPAALAPATILICGVIGTVMCFALNAFFAAVRQGLDVCKSVEIKNYNEADKYEILQRMIRFDHDFDKKQCYLDYKLLTKESAFDEDMVTYQKMKLLRSVMIDLLVPPVIFLSLVFVPLGIGIPMLAVAFAFAVFSHYYVEEKYKPKEVILPEFDEEAFHAFNPYDELKKLRQQDNAQGFFGLATDYLRDKETDPLILNGPPELS